jgi:hypothetical protein
MDFEIWMSSEEFNEPLSDGPFQSVCVFLGEKRDIPVAPRIPTLISCLVAGIVCSMKEKE